jgi:hypothetical protein
MKASDLVLLRRSLVSIYSDSGFWPSKQTTVKSYDPGTAWCSRGLPSIRSNHTGCTLMANSGSLAFCVAFTHGHLTSMKKWKYRRSHRAPTVLSSRKIASPFFLSRFMRWELSKEKPFVLCGVSVGRTKHKRSSRCRPRGASASLIQGAAADELSNRFFCGCNSFQSPKGRC